MLKQTFNMRHSSVTEYGEIVYHRSVSKEVEQFHYLMELMEAKEVKKWSKSKSTIDFQSLQFNNKASWDMDQHQEEEIFHRRYTLPRGFTYTARANGIKTSSAPSKAVQERKEEFENLTVCKSLSNLCLHTLFSQDEPLPMSDCGKSTSFQNLNLKELFYEPKAQESIKDFHLASLFREDREPKCLGDLYLKSLFKETEIETDPFDDDEDINLDLLFHEKRTVRSNTARALKNIKKAFLHPLKAVRRAASRLC